MVHRLIVLEGIDGVGKSTLVDALVKRMNKEGAAARSFSSLGVTSLLTPEQKKWAREEAPIEGSLALYGASLLHKSAHVRTALKESSVVMDRYVHSLLADHLARGLPERYARQVLGLPYEEPTRVVHVRADEPIRLARAREREGATADDLESTADTRTRLGRMLQYFNEHLAIELWTHCTVEENVDWLWNYVSS